MIECMYLISKRVPKSTTKLTNQQGPTELKLITHHHAFSRLNHCAQSSIDYIDCMTELIHQIGKAMTNNNNNI